MNIKRPGPTSLVAWAGVLLVSSLPDILFDEVLGYIPPWLLGAKLAVIALLLVAGLFWQPARSLRALFAALGILYLGSQFFSSLQQTPAWGAVFRPGSFVSNMLGVQLGRLAVAAAIILALYLLGLRRSDLYLTRGHLAAPASGVHWLGIDEGTSWKNLGPILAFLIGLGTLAFLLLGATALRPLAPLLPMVLLLAAMNAFSEEVAYRSAFLGGLEGSLGARQAVLLSAVFFGIGHYYGVPNGPLGSLMAGLLGWLLGKAMVETKGFFWPWFIHFVQDVLIFSVMAFSSMA